MEIILTGMKAHRPGLVPSQSHLLVSLMIEMEGMVAGMKVLMMGQRNHLEVVDLEAVAVVMEVGLGVIEELEGVDLEVAEAAKEVGLGVIEAVEVVDLEVAEVLMEVGLEAVEVMEVVVVVSAKLEDLDLDGKVVINTNYAVK